ncbi:hypothetical protein AC249_AIPGENE25017, partial [Exaiptasia diaphana]
SSLEGVAAVIPSVFNYPCCMTRLTPYRLKRIRHADADDIARMVDQENYWSTEALREILKRIETLNTEDPLEALEASRHALRILERVREISPDLRALTTAIHGAALRYNGELDKALAMHEHALSLKGLSGAGRGNVLARMAVTLVHLGQLDRGLAAVDEALTLVSDVVPVLVVRGWIRMFTNPLKDALDDFVLVLEHVRETSRPDYSLFCAIVNCCNLLSYETLDVEEAFIERMRREITAYRKILPAGGSNYRKAQRPRLILSRAEALVLARDGQAEKAVTPLQRAAEGLKPHYPDDALDAHMDLMWLLTKLQLETPLTDTPPTDRCVEAVQIAKSAVELLDRVTYRVPPMGRIALLT